MVALLLHVQVYACASHAVFSPPAVERLSSGVFEEVIVTNTIPLKPVRNSWRHMRRSAPPRVLLADLVASGTPPHRRPLAACRRTCSRS